MLSDNKKYKQEGQEVWVHQAERHLTAIQQAKPQRQQTC